MAAAIQPYKASWDKIFINRPAVDLVFFCRKRDYGNTDRIQILSIGRLVFQKGFMIGMLAMVELLKWFSNFEWIIIGDGPEDEELLFNIHLSKLHNHIKLGGKKDRQEVLELYETTDI